MKKGLIDNTINNMLNDLVGKCFHLNRILDRGMSLLGVRWNMIQSAEILHEELAHAFLGNDFADKISNYQATRSCETIYPATPTGDTEYNSPKELFDYVMSEVLVFQDMLYDTYEAANEAGDIATKSLCGSVIGNLVEMTNKIQAILDLFENFGTTPLGMALLDASIDKYFDS